MDQTSGGIKREHWEEILDREMLIIFLLSREAVSKEEYLFLKRKLDFVNHFKKTVLGKPVKEQKQSFIKKRLKKVVRWAFWKLLHWYFENPS